MPFRPAPPGPPMPPNPDIRIFFQGLLMLRASDDYKLCVVETHRRPSFPHTLSIEVRAKLPQGPDVILMRHFGPLDDPGLVINGGYDIASSVVYKHQPSSFNNQLGIGEPDDFRWIVNLEGRLFHERLLSVDTTGTRPGPILLEHGIYYFYTARKKTGRITRTGGGKPNLDLTGIASTVGANLSIGANPVVLTWHERRDHTLKLEKVEGTSYEIYIDNSPLFLDLDEGPRHSELNEYYDVLPGAGARFDLDFHTVSLEGSAKFNTIMSTPNIPCQSIVLETPDG